MLVRTNRDEYDKEFLFGEGILFEVAMKQRWYEWGCENNGEGCIQFVELRRAGMSCVCIVWVFIFLFGCFSVFFVIFVSEFRRFFLFLGIRFWVFYDLVFGSMLVFIVQCLLLLLFVSIVLREVSCVLNLFILYNKGYYFYYIVEKFEAQKGR